MVFSRTHRLKKDIKVMATPLKPTPAVKPNMGAAEPHMKVEMHAVVHDAPKKEEAPKPSLPAHKISQHEKATQEAISRRDESLANAKHRAAMRAKEK